MCKLRDYAEDRVFGNKPGLEWDLAGLLDLKWETWNELFRQFLGPAARGLVGELRGHHNKWAHRESFSSNDVYRALDSIGRLLAAVSTPQSEELEKVKMDLCGYASMNRRGKSGSSRRARPRKVRPRLT